MSEPLYLKYRPQKLAELVGQEMIARTLNNAINMNRIAHAYFFTGPRGCGKTSSARILAKSVNCKNGPTIDPCGTCTNCLEIAQGISPDVIEIDAASHRSVEDAAQVIEKCHLAPQTAQHKIYIFDEVHMLSKEAFNALLKTIEEPPNNVIFILATTEENKVPSTIISRCQKFAFRTIETEPLLKHLNFVCTEENIKLSEKALLKIVKQSKGGLRDALSLLDQISILAPIGELIEDKAIFDLFGAVSEEALGELLQALINYDKQKAWQITEDFLKAGQDTLQLQRNLIEFATDRLEADIKTNKASDRLITLIDELMKAEYSLRTASQPVLKLKTIILSLCVQTINPVNSVSNQSFEPNNNSNNDKQIQALSQKIQQLEKEIENLNKNKTSINNYSASKNSNSTNKPEKSSSESNLNSSNTITDLSKAEDILQNLYPKIGPVNKALMQGGKVFISSINEKEIIFSIPINLKTFFDKLNNPKKIQDFESALAQILGNSISVQFKLSDNHVPINSSLEFDNSDFSTAPLPSINSLNQSLSQSENTNQNLEEDKKKIELTEQKKSKPQTQTQKPIPKTESKPEFVQYNNSFDNDSDIIQAAKKILGAKF